MENKEILPEDRLKVVNDFLNEKPASKSRGGFWNNLLGFFAVAAKAYLRYEDIKSRK